MPKLQVEPELRFWGNAKRSPEGCWEWQSGKAPNGYGKFWLQGQTLGAHRIAFRLANGAIPSGLMVCHICDNRACVRPSHLFLGTATDNMQDCLKKGRLFDHRGERCCRAKLSSAQVDLVRSRLSKGELHRIIAADFNVKRATISKINRDKSWRV
ncbi:MAG: HNH endonuclease [Gammaproteobacteria bacterium]